MNKKMLQEISLKIGVVVGLVIVVCVTEAHSQSFVKEPFTYNQKIVLDIPHLQMIAQEVSDFFKTVPRSKYVQVSVGTAFEGRFTLEDVQRTIDFLASQAKKNPQLLKQHWFYREHFDFYRWHTHGCEKTIGPLPRGWQGCPEAVRITKYRISKIHGSLQKTKEYSFPLYEVPTDEKGKTPEYIKIHQSEFLRFAFDREAIVAGALQESGKTRVLAWVNFEGYKELAMQGSVLVVCPHDTFLIKVTGNNGMPGAQQYWFCTVYQNKKSSKKYPVKVEPVAGVSFAGNIDALGFGKLIMVIGKNSKTLEKEMRLGVLVDTGSAFKNNLCQLDLFTGYFEHDHLFKDHCKQYPHTAQVYILIKKKKK